MNLFFLWKTNFLVQVLVFSGIHHVVLLEFYDYSGFNSVLSVYPTLPFLIFFTCFISSYSFYCGGLCWMV